LIVRLAMLAEPQTSSKQSQAASRAALTRPKRRFNLSLRALLIIVLVLGAWLGWFVRMARVQREAVAAIEKAGGSVAYDIDWRNEGFNPYARPWTPMRLLDGKLWGTKWLIHHLGIDYFGSVVTADLIPSRANNPTRADDATLALVGQLARLQSLRLTGTAVTDAGLAYLAGLTSLRDLQMGNTQITDAGLAHIRELVELRSVLLFNTRITDAGLEHLKRLPNLVLVDLARTRVTDDGVLELERASSSHPSGLRGWQARRSWPGMIQVSREEDGVAFDAQARALKDVDYAATRPIRLACQLLSNRAQVMADRGQKEELIATCHAVCGLKADDKVSLLRLAQACAACVKSLDSPRLVTFSAEEQRALKQRCADRGIAALSRAVNLGLYSVPHLEDHRLEPLHGNPGFGPLVEKVRSATSGR
jgi:hypothetical protein